MSRKPLPLTFLVMTTAASLALASPVLADVYQFEEHDPPVTETFACGAVYAFTTDLKGREATANGNESPCARSRRLQRRRHRPHHSPGGDDLRESSSRCSPCAVRLWH